MEAGSGTSHAGSSPNRPNWLKYTRKDDLYRGHRCGVRFDKEPKSPEIYRMTPYEYAQTAEPAQQIVACVEPITVQSSVISSDRRRQEYAFCPPRSSRDLRSSARKSWAAKKWRNVKMLTFRLIVYGLYSPQEILVC